MVSEDDNVFDTSIPYLSHLTYREWHAFVNGFYVGITAYKSKVGGDEGREKHYWRGGFTLGWFIKVAVILAVAPSNLL